MRRALLIVDHGSRSREANELLEAVAEDIRARSPACSVHIAHLELALPDIAGGIDACVAAGAAEVVVQPFFLGPGLHTSRDIPRRVADATIRHPGLRVSVAAPLGPHRKLVDIVLERTREVQ